MGSFGSFLKKAGSVIGGTAKKVYLTADKLSLGTLPGGVSPVSMIKSGYLKADKISLGLLPGGQSYTKLATERKIKSNAEQIEYNKQKINSSQIKDDYDIQKSQQSLNTTKQMEILQAQEDIYNNSWLEDVFGRTSEYEKSFQDVLQAQAYYKSAPQEIINTLPSFKEYTDLGTIPEALLSYELPNSSPTGGVSNVIKSLTMPLLIVGAIVILPKLIKK